MSELLRISGLWGGYKEGVDILRGINLVVQEGESVGVIGLNGSGKSTLGKAIMNMIPIRKGNIFFKGEDITCLSTFELSRKGISIMQQGGQVFQNLSVWDNLEIAFASKDYEAFEQIKQIVPILQRPKHTLQGLMADKLSGGQKHQLSLAMTLASQPRIVILDEPSAGLSPKAIEEMYEILHAMREKLNVTILLIEQNISKAIEFCDTNIVIQNGTIVNNINSATSDSIENIIFTK